jgi:hypothetical protein
MPQRAVTSSRSPSWPFRTIGARKIAGNSGRLRPHLDALLLGCYTDDGKLIHAWRVGTGIPAKVLATIDRFGRLRMGCWCP